MSPAVHTREDYALRKRLSAADINALVAYLKALDRANARATSVRPKLRANSRSSRTATLLAPLRELD